MFVPFLAVRFSGKSVFAAAPISIMQSSWQTASGDRLINSACNEETVCHEEPMVRYRISPKFLAIVAEEGLVIHDPSFYNFTLGRNLCVRPDIGRSSYTGAFSSPSSPAARASFTATVF
jgi:hypothetical protein